MVKYIRLLLLGILVSTGFLFNFDFNDFNSSKKGMYYNLVNYSNNVSFNQMEGLDLDYSAELTGPGDSYYIDFDVVNDSNVDMKILELDYPKDDSYISYRLTYRDGSIIKSGDIISKGESIELTYAVSYNHPIEQEEYYFDSSFHIEYEQVI